MKKVLLITLLLILYHSFAFAASPVIFYSDITSGPTTGGKDNKGAFVTIFGKNFGATQGTSYVTIGGGQADNYPSWSDTKISFQLGANAATGNIVVTTTAGTSNELFFTIRTCQIRFVATTGIDSADGSYATPWLTYNKVRTSLPVGGICYIRGGTYTGATHGITGKLFYISSLYPWGSGATVDGAPYCLVGYPGETVTWSGTSAGFTGSYNTTQASNIVFANIVCNANSTTGTFSWNGIGNGGSPRVKNLRVVNVELYGGSGTITAGWMGAGGDGPLDNVKYLGIKLHDCTTPDTMTHLFYCGAGGDNYEVGWSSFYNLNTSASGYGLQMYTSASANYAYFTNLSLHDNLLYDCVGRGGINVSQYTVSANVYNNIIYGCSHVGYASMSLQPTDAAVSSTVNVYNNVIYQVSHAATACIRIWGSSATSSSVTINFRNNIFFTDSTTPYVYEDSATYPITKVSSNNCWYGNGAPPSWASGQLNSNPLFFDATNHDFHLQGTSLAKDTGTSSVSSIVTRDYDGILRPQGAGYDIGAYEYAIDLIRPSVVTDLAAGSPTSNTVVLSWHAPGNDGNNGQAASYDIRYSTADITEANWASATQTSGEPNPSTAGETQLFIVTGLTSNAIYYFALKTTDYAGNISGISNTTSATTSGSGSGGGGGGGGCFIATASYGDSNAGEILVLDKFRDRYLLTNKLGRAFVKFYYKHSPPIAKYIGKREWVKSVVRGILRPIVWLAEKAIKE